MLSRSTDLNGNEKRFTDEVTDKRIHELLSNEKDDVTEDDIKNIRTDVEIREEHVPNENEKIKDDTDPEIDNTSWNVLEGDN